MQREVTIKLIVSIVHSIFDMNGNCGENYYNLHETQTSDGSQDNTQASQIPELCGVANRIENVNTRHNSSLLAISSGSPYFILSFVLSKSGWRPLGGLVWLRDRLSRQTPLLAGWAASPAAACSGGRRTQVPFTQMKNKTRGRKQRAHDQTLRSNLGHVGGK
jgi:hypothetical protein